MSARPLLILLLFSVPGCVSYQADVADPQTIAMETLQRRGGTFTVDGAIALALRQNPDLRALEANARAAGAATTVPLTVQGELRGRSEAVGVMIDPIALLGLGPRGAAIDAQSARHVEAVLELAVARWRTAAAVAEAFVIDAALSDLRVPELTVDAAAFERAGLASPVAAGQLRAAQARARSEQVELERAREDNLAQLRHLLGLPRSASLRLTRPAADWLRQPSGSDADLLARPDLALAVARFGTADADFKKAVADQYPSLQIGPNVSLVGDPLRAMGMLQLPFGMRGLARAAQERRQATRDELEGVFLAAHREATIADDRLAAALTAARASASELAASTTELTAARTAIEVELSAFAQFSRTARAVMRDTTEHRLATVVLARARVQRALAYGWPRATEPTEGES